MSDTAVQPSALELKYSTEALDQELLDAAQDFAVQLQGESVTRLFGKDVMSRIAGAGRAVQQRLESPFSIMIVGDFKRGKSTLINALVGQSVAPADVQPETISINRIEYAEEFSATIQSKDGRQASVAQEDLKRERLEPLLRKLSTPLRHLRVGVPAEILSKVTLIDTPGLGDLFREFEPVVREYMDQADTIVIVLSSTSPLSQTEQEFLLRSIAPRQFPKVFFVVNAMDVLASEDEERRVLDLIFEKLNRIMPGSSVYGISALDEWSRVSGGARPRPARAEHLAQRFAKFRADLDSAIQFRQRYFVLDRAAYAFSTTVELVEQRATGLEAALQHDRAQLDEAVQALADGQNNKSKEFQAAADALEKSFEGLRREADGWMLQFLDRFEADVLKSLRSFKSSQIRQHLPFFMKDRLRRGIEACLLAHEPVIADLMEEYARGMQSEATKAVAEKIRVDSVAPVGAGRWSKFQTAQLVAELLQVGMLVQVGMAIFGRQRADAQSAQVADAIAQSLPELRDEIRSQVRAAYSTTKNHLITEWTRRHEEEVKAHLEDLKQAMELRDSGSQQVDSAHAKLAEVRELLASRKVFLEQFKPKVWSGVEVTD